MYANRAYFEVHRGAFCIRVRKPGSITSNGRATITSNTSNATLSSITSNGRASVALLVILVMRLLLVLLVMVARRSRHCATLRDADIGTTWTFLGSIA